jgi:hypothetical protein
MKEPYFTITELQEEQEVARFRVQDEQARRNGEWLQTHWSELLPQALGKFIAMAGQQVFVADTPDQARAQAQTAHPWDQGVLVQYVRAERGPRLYANHR